MKKVKILGKASLISKEKSEFGAEMDHIKEVHAADRERMVNDLMIAKKEIENLLRMLRRLESDKEKLLADKEALRQCKKFDTILTL